MRSLPGRLFGYHPATNLCAFSTELELSRHLVFIGGLTDGFMACTYVEPLAELCKELRYDFCQPLLSSSYTGYGTSSLAADADELDELLECLNSWEDHASAESDAAASSNSCEVVLMGHSTGCQDAVTYMRRGRNKTLVKGVILQAPVSDRESAEMGAEETRPLVALAREMREAGKAEELMPRSASHGVPITASRYLSLAAGEGDDELFSSDLGVDTLRTLLGHMEVPTLILFSGADQYVPDHVDKQKLVRELELAMPGASGRGVLLEGADHSCSSSDAAEKLIFHTRRFLKEVGGEKGGV